MKHEYIDFNDEEVLKLKKYKIKPEVANKFGSRFAAMDINWLIKNGAKPEDVNKYPEYLSSDATRMLYEMSVPPEIITRMDKRYAQNIVAEIQMNFMGSRFEDVEVPGMWNCIGTGSSAIILLRDNAVAWKFSESLTREYALIKHINDNSSSLNVIKAKKLHPKKRMFFKPSNKEDPAGAMEIQYINGDSLENILQKDKILSADKIINYTKDVLNGLIEMRYAGVWNHRDIRPANIMIDYKNDMALIIDLEYASIYQSEVSRDNGNRRFNGPNDLSSLGQLAYYAAIGKSVFYDDKSKNNDLSDVADKIVIERKKAYNNVNGKIMREALGRVDTDIKDKYLAGAIKELLTAKPNDHEKIMKMMQ